MMAAMKYLGLAVLAVVAACSGSEDASSETLAQARAAHATQVAQRADTDTPVEAPPRGVFDVVQYPSPSGDLAAYVTPDNGDGQRRPAIIWMTGGDTSTIGDVWSPSDPSNDQSARAFREAGIVMMFPSLRGGNRNPGEHEALYGEVQDVLAAADWLAQQPHVDPQRIYLGGHSTGGTLALLTSEASGRFRAVFSFGPVSRFDNDYSRYLGAVFDDQRELDLRSPGLWLGSITSPTFVFEGDGRGNGGELLDMAGRSRNPAAHFFLVKGADHFSILAPTTRLIAERINADTGATSNLTFDQADLDRLFAGS